MELALIHRIIVILINISGSGLALWVLLANWKARLNQLFFLSAILMCLWTTFSYLGTFSHQIYYALLYYKLTFGVAFFYLISGWFFAIYFPKEEKRYPVLDRFVLIIGLTFCFIVVFTDLIIKDVEFKAWGADIVFGKGTVGFYGAMSIVAFLIVGLLLKKYFKLSKSDKLKTQYLFIGILISAAANLIFNVFFPSILKTYKYHLLGDFSNIFILGFTAYAIVKRELFEIKVILTDILVGVIGLILLILPLFSESLIFKIISWIIFGLFVIFGYLLIRYSHREAKQKEILEEKVRERTKELEEAKNIAEEKTSEAEEKTREIEKRKEELERVLKAVVGRELRMIELKKRIKELEEKLKKE